MSEQQYDNRNRGSFFKNDSENEKAPQIKGTVNVICPHCGADHDHGLAAWRRTAASGKPYYQVKMEPKEAQGQYQAQAQAPRAPAAPAAQRPAKPQAKKVIVEQDDDIPF